MADATNIPGAYIPNTNLTWVEKATHIWALHPSDFTKADKGSLVLNLAGTAPDSGTIFTDNTMVFNGTTWFQAGSQFVFGDYPWTAGNQTPPIRGGMSCWVLFYNFHATNPMALYGGHDPAGPLVYVDTTGHIKAKVGNVEYTYATSLSLNTWYHIAVTNEGSGYLHIYVNGVAVVAQPAGSAGMTDDYFQIGKCQSDTLTIEPIHGRMRLMAVVNGAIWTPEEVAEQHDRPYAYYAPLEPVKLNLAELKTELTTDPKSYGYAPFIASGEMQVLADMLNAEQGDIAKVFRAAVSSMEINARLYADEYYAMSAARRLLWDAFTQADLNMQAAPNMRGQIEHLFAAGSFTVADLQNLVWTRDSTRAEQLWSVGVTVRWQDCAAALALP